MPAELFDRFVPPAVSPRSAPDAAFAARPRLVKLRDALTRAAKALARRLWNEPAVFFFDPRRQAELEAARPAAPGCFAELTSLIESELDGLFATVEVRRTARALDGLSAAARAMSPHCPAARELADLLAVPDDEVFLVLAPAARTGVRLHLRGAADVSQLRRLVAEPNPPSPFPGREGGGASSNEPRRFLGGETLPPARERHGSSVQAPPPSLPGKGGGGLGSSAFPQLFAPAALRSDGTLPPGFAGCGHWLWPTQPLAAVPRINGERVVLAGPATVQAPDAEPRFPTLAVEVEVIQALNPFQTAELLSRLCGQLVPVQPPVEVTPVARAA